MGIFNNTMLLGTSFNPKSLSGLVLWLDGSDPDANGVAPSNGSSVTTWTDKSTSANNYTQSTAGNKPVFNAGLQNGLGGVVFDGSKYMTGGSTNFPTGSTGRSLFVVFKATTFTGSNQYFIFFYGTYSASQVAKSFGATINSASNWFELNIYGTGLADNSPIACAQNTNFIYDISYPAATRLDGSVLKVNGTTETNSTEATVPNTVIEQSIIGEFYNGGGGGFIGNIYEIIQYNTQLSTGDQTRVRQYLSNKWAITIS